MGRGRRIRRGGSVLLCEWSGGLAFEGGMFLWWVELAFSGEARARSRKSVEFCVAFAGEFRQAFCRAAASQYAVRSLRVVLVVQSDECLIRVAASLNATRLLVFDLPCVLWKQV
jgi:hypothetical protein